MPLANKPIGTVAYLGGVPAVLEEFCWSWGNLIQFTNESLCEPGKYVHWDRAKVSFHAYARNTLADRMAGDWLLMLDTDHSFEPDIAVRMLDRLERYDIDVLVGCYTFKMPPYIPTLFRTVPAEKEGGIPSFVPIGKWESDADADAALQPVDSAGAGCLMVRRKVFDRIREELKEEPFDIIPPLGEDHSFFVRLKKLGISAWFDPRIEFPHLTTRSLSLADFDVSAVQLSERQPVEALVCDG